MYKGKRDGVREGNLDRRRGGKEWEGSREEWRREKRLREGSERTGLILSN